MASEYWDTICQALPALAGLFGVNVMIIAVLTLLWFLLDPNSESFVVVNLGLVLTVPTTVGLAWHLLRCRSHRARQSDANISRRS
jgi:fatty-acid desaturase